MKYHTSIEQAEKLEAIRDWRKKCCSEIQAEFVRISVWDVFESQFTDVKQRYKFFVLEGRSQTGKTSYVNASQGSPGSVYYCSCAGDKEPDLRQFDYFKHKLILLDEATPATVLAHKDLLQSSNEIVRMGTSKTNCHSYEVFCGGTKFVICTNRWKAECDKLDVYDREWIESNQMYYNTEAVPLFKIHG